MTATDDPTDALSVLADETRVAILRALAEAEEPLPFSRLRDRAGVGDSGRFNYHLRRLCEYFVRETPAGYELGHAGTRLVAATGVGRGGSGESGAATPTEAVPDPGDVPLETDECPVCGDADCDKLFHVHLSPSPF